jgi:hypothetical protein
VRLLASPDDLRAAEREAATARGVVVMDAADWQVGRQGRGKGRAAGMLGQAVLCQSCGELCQRTARRQTRLAPSS